MKAGRYVSTALGSTAATGCPLAKCVVEEGEEGALW